MTTSNLPLWQQLENAVSLNPYSPGVPDLVPADWAIILNLLADLVEQRSDAQLDLDPSETADWLRHEARAACDPIPTPSNPTPVTVGEILKEEFLDPLGLSLADFAKHIGLTERSVNSIISGKIQINNDIDSILGNYFGLSTGYWLRLQNQQHHINQND